MRLGIDVGGTNTDAVLIDGNTVLASAKRPTTENVTDGIVAVTQTLLNEAGVGGEQLQCIMLGTTQFTNAFVERRGLQRVGILRLGSPASEALPPLSGWPDTLVAAINPVTYLLPGGYEFDGREISPFDAEAVKNAAVELNAMGISSVAVSCTFSQMNPAMEKQVQAIFNDCAPSIQLTLSSAFGRPGFLERENAAIMNASLTHMAERVIASFVSAFEQLGLTAPLYISQNDGTLISASHASEFPVYTFGSGPTNSMRGAAFLTGLQDAIVIDIGGTTSDIGALTHGFPRESTLSVDIGGVRTSFRMPDILAIGLGGGTRITDCERAPDGFAIGPDSVGYRLHLDALLFGGDVLTTSDIAVAAGRSDFGDSSLLQQLDTTLVNKLLQRMDSLLEEGLDRVKLSRGAVPVILVGGGSVIAPKSLQGASQVIRPQHASVANAVGAAFAKVGAEAESIVSYDEIDRDAALSAVKQQASALAEAAGAQRDTIQIIDVDEVYLSYIPGNRVQIRVKAVGDLALINRGDSMQDGE